jgi:GntR family transcriptional regulator
MSGPTDSRDLQTRIADRIRGEIETGQRTPGEQLPTFDVLAEQFKCSTGTVRSAIEMLKQQGLIITRQGLGTFVRERPTARRYSADRYRRSVWMGGTPIMTAEAAEQGLEASQMIRMIGEVPAPPEVARRFGITPGTPVLARKRTTMIEGRPNQLADSYYELDTVALVPQLAEEDTGPGGGWARLEDAGIHLTDLEEMNWPRMPTSPESVALELPPGTPVEELIRTTYDGTGRVREVMLAVVAGDMVVFYRKFPIPD